MTIGSSLMGGCGLSHKCVGFQPQNVKLHTRALAVMVSFSLIPRPFPPPVLDRLQQANMEGKGLGDLSMCGDIRQTEGRHTVGGARWRISKPFLVLSVQGLEARALARQRQHHLLFTASEMVGHKTGIIAVRYRPPYVPTWHHQISQAFPLHICMLQATKYWRWEWPGNGLGTRLGKFNVS